VQAPAAPQEEEETRSRSQSLSVKQKKEDRPERLVDIDPAPSVVVPLSPPAPLA
jgi:hypothetical protein